MLCTSILSEIVLGFLMWTGWLTTTQPAEAAYPAPEYALVPPPLSAACPQACVGIPAPACIACPAPACPTQDLPLCPVDANGIEVVKVLSLPPHLTACDIKDVFNRCAGTSMPCDKPCSWKIHSAVKSPAAGGVEVEIALTADGRDGKEVYRTTRTLAFDAPTDVTLTGDRPEPVCLRVAARRPAPPMMMMPSNDVAWGGHVWSLPAPVAYAPPMPPPFATPAAPQRIPEPLPLYPSATPYIPDPPVVPASLVLPAPTPVHRASVKLVYESGKPRLCVKSAGMTTECLRMKLEAGAAGAVRLSAGKNHVHLAGTRWKAEADRVELGDDGRIMLAGHVKLTSDKLGVCASVKAERLCVEVKAGKFEKIVEPK